MLSYPQELQACIKWADEEAGGLDKAVLVDAVRARFVLLVRSDKVAAHLLL
jgi:hypothetical protein